MLSARTLTVSCVPVFSGAIDRQSVALDLQEYGIAVVSASRPEAAEIAKSVREMLQTRISIERWVAHLTFQVEPCDFEHCFSYNKIAELHPDTLGRLTVGAIKAWRLAGAPDYFVHKVSEDPNEA